MTFSPEFMEFLKTVLLPATPAITAILGIIFTALGFMKKVKGMIDEFRKDETLKELNRKVECMLAENQRLNTVNRQLIDQLTKIANYTDAKEVKMRLSNIRTKGENKDDTDKEI
jgi:regulator of replication initiation timing